MPKSHRFKVSPPAAAAADVDAPASWPITLQVAYQAYRRDGLAVVILALVAGAAYWGAPLYLRQVEATEATSKALDRAADQLALVSRQLQEGRDERRRQYGDLTNLVTAEAQATRADLALLAVGRVAPTPTPTPGPRPR